MQAQLKLPVTDERDYDSRGSLVKAVTGAIKEHGGVILRRENGDEQICLNVGECVAFVEGKTFEERLDEMYGRVRGHTR